MKDREKYVYHTTQLLDAINLCLEQRFELPSLILLYSTIDIMGWLYSNKPKAKINENFKRWVSKYITSRNVIRCSPDDLWGARCGVLHTLTPESDKSKKGLARKICYAYGNATSSWLHDAINSSTGYSQKYVGVHVRELFEQLCKGMICFLDDLDNDPELAEKVYNKSNEIFDDVSEDTMHKIVGDRT